MIKKLLSLSEIQILNRREQKNVIGGKLAPRECGEDNPCNMKGWCCTDNYCIPSGPDENGIWPRCDYM